MLTGFAGILTIIMMSDLVPLLLSEDIQSGDRAILLAAAPIMAILTVIGVAYLVTMTGLLYFRKRWIWRLAVIMSFISIGLFRLSPTLTAVIVDY